MAILRRQWFIEALASLAAVVLLSTAHADDLGAAAALDAGNTLINMRCVGCHQRQPGGGWSRISGQRKTPEGWSMTISRMQHNHGLILSSSEKQAVQTYLADSQGLAPSEAAPYRYVLERRNNYIEQYNAINRPDDLDLARRCTVCHSYARFALQRRTEEEWRLLLHFHVAQYPAIEFHPASRISPWWEQVAVRLPPVLTQMYPLSSDAWQQWQQKVKSDISGSWFGVGRLPGVGFYSLTRKIRRAGADTYQTDSTWEFADGHTESREGTAIVYTGYEWRGRTAVRREDIREVFAVSEDGEQMSGRWFQVRHSELGADIVAAKIQFGTSRLLGVEPFSIRTGSKQRVTLYGVNLEGTPDFGPQIKVTVVSSAPERMVIDVAANAQAAVGVRPIRVGAAQSGIAFAVYRSIDHIRVEPQYAFSRLGEGGGKVPFVGAQFEALAYAADSGGASTGGGEIALGVVPAKWTLEPHTALAKEWDDQLFAGRITAGGQFIPAQGGINTARTKGTSNNTGDLDVKATALVGDQKLEGVAHLVVSTGMQFFNPPIR